MRRGILALLLFLVLLKPAAIPVWGQEETEELAGNLQEDLLNREEIKEVQKALEELLGEDSFSFFDMLLDLMNGETGQLKEEFSDLIREVFLRQLIQEKALFVEILLLVLAAALLTNFTHLFSEGQIGEVSFYVIYLLLLTMLVKAFGEMSLELLELLEGLGNFMKVLSPAYCLAVAAAGGTVGSAMFYQLALFAITAVQVLLAGVILPGINIYLLLLFVNLISKEDFLSRMAELLETVIQWTLKTLLTAVIGLQVVQRLIAPAVDSLRRSLLGKTAAALPGIGNAVNAVTEVVFGTAVLIRNCIGVTAMAVLLMAGLRPLVRLAVTSFLYRLLGALAQPVSDRRMVSALEAMGKGCGFLLRLLFTAELLFLLTIALLAGSLS